MTGSGTAPLSYQWSKNGTAISGATSASYTTPATAISDSGSQFTVVVSNSTGSVTSNTATLTVNATPVAITVNPNSATVRAGSTQQFAESVTGTSNTAVTWSVSGAGCTGAACGTISSNGLYASPASVPTPAEVSVKATSVADPTKSASASVTIVAAVAVLLSISPASASVPTTGTQLFNASVTGTSNTAVNWSLSGTGCSGSSCGTISTSASSAVYSAPSLAPSPATVIVIATSVADPTKSASASVAVVPVVAVTVNPPNASVPTGTTQQFNASLTGTSNTALAWSVTGAGCSGVACGTINSSGLYTAPAAGPSPAAVTVTATSVADPTKSGAVNLTIVGSVKNSPVLPTLPQAAVDITMPIQSGTVRNVTAGSASDFQAKLNAATCGDTIVLPANNTYTGNFSVPNEGACSGWILVVSSALSSLPSTGTRISAGCSAGTTPATICPPPSAGTIANMATITTNTTNDPAITFAAGSHNWRFIGLEVTSTVGLHETNLIETDVGATMITQEPSFIIIDRCYVHGALTSAIRRGMDLQGPSMSVMESDFREFHDQTTSPGVGADSQAIAAWTSPGPLLFRNNFLSAASENINFGGNDPSITNLVPSDITIVGNHFWKDWTNWHGRGFVVKNVVEFKNAQRVLLDGNVIEFSWADGQSGTAVMITVRNQGGTCPLCVVQDVTLTHNLIQHAVSGIETTGSDDLQISLPENRILIQNNVATDLNATTYGTGGTGIGHGIFSETDGGMAGLSANNIIVDHNDVFSNYEFLSLGDSGKIVSYALTNNLATFGVYGILGSGEGVGTSSLNFYLPTVTYNDMVFLTGTGSPGGTFPSGTFWNTTAGAGFTNYTGGNYQLTNASPYHNAGTDGKDIGVWDWTTFNAETSNALAGHYPQ